MRFGCPSDTAAGSIADHCIADTGAVVSPSSTAARAVPPLLVDLGTSNAAAAAAAGRARAVPPLLLGPGRPGLVVDLGCGFGVGLLSLVQPSPAGQPSPPPPVQPSPPPPGQPSPGVAGSGALGLGPPAGRGALGLAPPEAEGLAPPPALTPPALTPPVQPRVLVLGCDACALKAGCASPNPSPGGLTLALSALTLALAL